MENLKHLQASMGAGGLVFWQNKVLLVQLNYGLVKGSWILPGGMVDEGEYPEEAAIREVKEETGLEVIMHSLVAVRNRKLKDARLNSYWVFSMRFQQDPPEEPALIWPEDEIQQAKFWQVKEALMSSSVRPMTKEFIRLELEGARGWYNQNPPSDHRFSDSIFWGK